MATMVLGTDQMFEQASPTRAPRGRALSPEERNQKLYVDQLARRRGPTPEMFFTKHIDNSRIVKGDDPIRRREMRIFTVVMSLFFALTMVYVWQHFSAIETGYSVEAQKQQVETLREENRQLRLTEARLADPGRIDRIARQLGMAEPAPGQVIRQNDADGSVLAQAQTPVLP